LRVAVRVFVAAVVASFVISCGGSGVAPGNVVVVNGVEMIYIPGGQVTMGPFGADSLITEIKPYLIGKYEVTNREYRQFCEMLHIPFPVPPTRDDFPAVSIDFNAAEAFTVWKGCRLPTEAEWEFAAKGPEGRTFPWGDEWDDTKANFRGDLDGFPGLGPVGLLPAGASPFGVENMGGNAREWVSDWFTPYTNESVPNWRGAPGGAARVIKGGSYRTGPDDVVTTNRAWRGPAIRMRDVGFRLASDYPPRKRGELPDDVSPSPEVDVGTPVSPE